MDSVLSTKLHCPRTAPDLIERARLIERLEQGRDRPLTLICAPAGYGKSTLVSSWVASSNRPCAWLSLDDGDSDLPLFIKGLVASLRTLFPGVGQEVLSLFGGDATPDPRVLATAFVNALEEMDDEFWVVLDDYHEIRDTTVHDFLAATLNHPPDALHLVITSRYDPPLPIARCRARGQLTEIRPNEMRFSVPETLQFLEIAAHAPIDRAQAVQFNERTEGWAAGLRLVAITLSRDGDAERLLRELGGESSSIRDYLMGEILTQQSPATQEYLLKTAILDRFCAPLCEAVAGAGAVPSGQPELGQSEFLSLAARSNLFLIALDDTGTWYRFHRLFQDFLRQQLRHRLNEREVALLHSRAARWLEESRHLEEATSHHLAAGDEESAAAIVRTHRHDLMNQEEWGRLERWLRLLPEDLVRTDIELLALRAWICENRFRYTEMLRTLDRIEARLSGSSSSRSSDSPLRGEINALQSVRHYVAGDGSRAVELARRAINTLPPSRLSERGFALAVLAMAHQMIGEPGRAHAVAMDALSDQAVRGSTFHARILITLCHVHWMEANLPQLRRAATELGELGQASHLAESIEFAQYFLGIAAYEMNDRDVAESCLIPLVRRPHHSNTQNFAHGTIALGLVRQAAGDVEHARELADTVVTRALELQNPELIRIAEAFQADLALRQGRVAEAMRWADTFAPSHQPTRWRFFLPELTLAKVQMSRSADGSLAETDALLGRLHDHATATHGRRSLIDILALRALLAEQKGDEETALSALQDALHLAEPGGVIRPFLDLCPPMAGLLGRLARRKASVAFIGQILSSYEGTGRPREGDDARLPASVSGRGPSSIQSLTRRETEILSLLANRFSDKEIAKQLFIAPSTVKKHLNNVYGKLNVHDRREAVTKAAELRLI